MIRVNVGGMSAKEVANLILEHGQGQFQVKIGSDIEGAKGVAAGEADYYFGACATGGGGALSMAIAILGYQKCFTASMPGKQPKQEDINKAVKEGKKAFGFTQDHIKTVVPMIIKAILLKQSLEG